MHALFEHPLPQLLPRVVQPLASHVFSSQSVSATSACTTASANHDLPRASDLQSSSQQPQIVLGAWYLKKLEENKVKNDKEKRTVVDKTPRCAKETAKRNTKMERVLRRSTYKHITFFHEWGHCCYVHSATRHVLDCSRSDPTGVH
ncbi:hypothetical protein Scep_009676 [Stephania cephalantha]|uniref:Uncharacterized protein n=1 Tax=Stephania cephalantha TaxID=152367 RepID=A0AAP0JVX3_9MAGN